MCAEHFAVNVLAEDQKAVSGLFASRTPDKFAQCDWSAGAGDVPLIAGALAHFACRRETLVDAGDHVVLIGRVIDFDSRAGNPLGYFRGAYFSLGLEDRLVSAVAASGGTRVGTVLTRDGQVLFSAAADGTLSLPSARNIDALRAALAGKGLTAEIDFLYAVYEDRETGTHAIYYQGSFAGKPPQGMVSLPLAELPWDRIADTGERSMLKRYAGEFRHGAFGIYQGNETTGQVRRITGA